jgi:3-deoxy-manno-octulosonate cytidylyltransferase (CMP-KDO synthetase)
MRKKIIGIIPARYASIRFPGKPLVPIQGKTLIQRTYENASHAQLDEIVVATDDQRIYDHVKQFGGKVVMTSPDHINGSDRIAEVLLSRPDWMKDSIIINIQGDEPCIEPSSIDAIAQVLIEDPSGSMSTAVTPLRTEEEAKSSSVVKCVIDQKQNALYFSRGLIPSNKKHQYNPKFTYYRHIGIYAFRPEFLLEYQKLQATPLQLEEDLEQLKVLENGYRIKVAILDHISIGVDTPEDIKQVEQWLCKQNSSS